MDIKDLRYFVHIYEAKSFSAATHATYVTQQALSKAVGKMEAELGLRLFIRERNGVIPTEPCRILYERALPLLRAFDALTENLLEPERPVRGTVRIAMHKDLDTLYYSDILHRFNRKHPDIDVAIVSQPGKESEPMIAEEELDFSATILPTDEKKFVFQKIFEDELAVLVHSSSPLATRTSLECADIANENILLPDSKNKYHDLVRHAFLKHGLEPRFVPCNDHVGFMINLVADGEGVALVSTANLKWRDLRGTVIPKRLLPTVKRMNGFIHKRGRALPEAAAAFRDFLATDVPFSPPEEFHDIFAMDAEFDDRW